MSILRLGGSDAAFAAKVLSSDTAQRILECISDGSFSESDISSQLDIPLSTVHFHIQRLVKAGVVVSDEFTYSSKGKEVRMYRLAADHIIFSARPSLVPEVSVGLILASLAAGIVWFTRKAESVVEPAMMRAAPLMAESSFAVQDSVVSHSSSVISSVWPFVLLGSVVSLFGVYVAYVILRR